MSGTTASSKVCADASFVVRLLVDGPQHPCAEAVWQTWRSRGARVVAPFLLRYEVTNAVYRLARHGLLGDSEASAAQSALYGLPIEFRPEDWLHDRAFRRAQTHDLPTAYDAHYLALAEAEGAELWTADAKLAKAVRPALSWVRLLGEDDPAGGAGRAP